MLDIYEMILAAFLVIDKATRVRFFKEIFLIANVGLEIVFETFFHTLSSVNVDFLDQKLRWRTYITEKAFLTTKCIKLVEKKEFAVTALDLKYETFVIYIESLFATFFSSTLLNANIHLFRRFQIAGLIAEEVLTKIFNEYVDFVDVFFLDLTSQFLKHTEINNPAIKLVHG